MLHFLLTLLVTAVAILLVAYLIPGLVRVDGFGSALAAALVLAVVNALVRPVFVFLSFPITILTLGLFLFVINALMLWLVAAVVSGFRVRGFVGALVGSLIVSAVVWLADKLII